MSQTGLTSTPAGVARDDIRKGIPVVLRNGEDAVSSCRWVLLYRPPGSGASIINPNAPVANITPDVDGHSYRLQLSIGQGRASHGEVQIKVFRVRDASGFAVPAVGERGAEVNYNVGGNPNTAGSADEMVRHYLKMHNSRAVPLEFSLGPGASSVQAIGWDLPDAMLHYLYATCDLSTDIEIELYADNAQTMLMWTSGSQDATGGYRMIDHKTLTFGAGLPEERVYVKVTNNGVDASEITVGMRLGAM